MKHLLEVSSLDDKHNKKISDSTALNTEQYLQPSQITYRLHMLHTDYIYFFLLRRKDLHCPHMCSSYSAEAKKLQLEVLSAFISTNVSCLVSIDICLYISMHSRESGKEITLHFTILLISVPTTKVKFSMTWNMRGCAWGIQPHYLRMKANPNVGVTKCVR